MTKTMTEKYLTWEPLMIDVSGTPNDTYFVKVRVISIAVSLDDGKTYGPEIMRTAGFETYEIPHTGLTLSFERYAP